MRIKLSFNFLNLIFIFFIAPIGTLASDAPIQYQILTFPGPGRWEATSTILTPTSSGFLKTTETTPLYTGGNCGDIFDKYQSIPVNEMAHRGYITEEMRQTLLDFHQLGIKSQQLVLISQFSEIPVSEAERLFGGTIPKQRKTEGLSKDQKKIRINRGTLYFVRGYEPQLDEHQRLKLTPLSLPWEKGNPLPSALTRTFDRKKTPTMIEIGRAFMEKGVLPGDMNAAVHVLITYLYNESRTLKIKPQDLLLTAHFLDPQHARLFTHAYPLRPLSPKFQMEIENDSATTMNSYLNRPLPKGKDWDEHPDTVVVGTLAEALKKFPLETISEQAHQLEIATNGKIKGSDAIDFFRDIALSWREIYAYSHPDVNEESIPIIIEDFGTSLIEMKNQSALHRVGLSMTRHKAEKFFDKLDIEETGKPELDSSEIAERAFHIPIDWKELANQKSQSFLDPRGGLIISNIDPRMANAHPIQYLAAVVIAAAKLIQHKIENLDSNEYAIALESQRIARQKRGLSKVDDFSFNSFLETFELAVASTDKNINDQAQRLGGKPVQGVSVIYNFDHGPANAFSLNVPKQEKVYFYKFDEAAIAELKRAFPQYSKDAHKILKPGLHMLLMKMALSGVF